MPLTVKITPPSMLILDPLDAPEILARTGRREDIDIPMRSASAVGKMLV